MTRRPHVVVINRWRARYARYESYLDHRRFAVTYLTTRVGAAGVPPGAAEVALVERTDDPVEARRAVRELAARHGRPCAVVALKEDDLIVAAQLATGFNCATRSPAELQPFRDKLAMWRAVRRAGIPAPPVAVPSDAAGVARFGDAHGWPVVIKPRVGSASEGVAVLGGPGELEQVPEDLSERYLVQAHVTDPIHHVDGVFDGTRLGPCRSSRYLSSCLDFRSGTPLASVEVDDPKLNRELEAFTLKVLRALTGSPAPFHLEVFVGRPGTGPRIRFLEIGARVGGSEIPFLWREVHGYDLMEAAFAIALGIDPPDWQGWRAGAVAGWLLLPAPAERPCRIVQATSMVGRHPGPYAEQLLAPGEILPAADAYYEHVGGRFRFRGATTCEVEAAIRATIRDARVRAEPVAREAAEVAIRR